MAFPTFTSTISNDGTALFADDDGRHQKIRTGTVEEARQIVFEKVSTEAETRDESVMLVSVEDGHTFRIVVHPDGSVEELPAAVSEPIVAPEPEPAGIPIPDAQFAPETTSSIPLPQETTSAPFRNDPPSSATMPGVVEYPAAASGVEPETPTSAPIHRRPTTVTTRRSFVEQHKQEAPAKKGWRGLFTQLGIRMAPSATEIAEREDTAKVAQHWPGPRTISVVNAKGGASKTSSVVLISAMFARAGRGGVLAWDNNQTRGTLGWRTTQGPHESTLLDMLPHTQELVSSQAQIGDLARFVHHQPADGFDVLRSKPSEIADAQRIRPEDVKALHEVAAKYYRMIVMDSGNDESDPMWSTMIDLTDQLVLATTNRVEPAEAGALLLENLAKLGPRYEQLAQNAVVIVSVADKTASKTDIDNIVSGFEAMVRRVVTIPFDPAMIDGHLAIDNLRPETQRAALAAAAAIADGLHQ